MPVIENLDPSRGPAAGGFRVTLTGRGFRGASKVAFGDAESDFQVSSDRQIVVTAPALQVTDVTDVSVTVTVADQTSDPKSFTAIPTPELTGVIPLHLHDPDTEVTVRGRHLTDTSAVFFGTAPSTEVRSGDPPDTSVIGRRPPGPTGPTRITVVTPGGTSNAFTVTFLPDWSQLAIFIVQLCYLALLVAGIIAYNTWDGLRGAFPNPLGPIPLAVPWFGAFGAVTLSLSGLVDHRIDWDRSYIFWHISRPAIGLAFGTAVYLVFAAGVLASGGTPSNATPQAVATTTPSVSASMTTSAGASAEVPLSVQSATTSSSASTSSSGAGTSIDSSKVNNLFYYIVAFVVGFREKTFRELIKRVSDVILGPGGGGSTGQAASASPPAAATTSDGTSPSSAGGPPGA
jgi:hypothetical protein